MKEKIFCGIWWTLLAISIFFWFGCSPEREVQRVINTVIKYDTVKFQLPTEIDTIYIKDGNGENVRYVVTVQHDTIRIQSKPRVITTTHTDTVTVTQIKTVKEENNVFEDLKTLMFMSLGIGVVMGVLNMFRK